MKQYLAIIALVALAMSTELVPEQADRMLTERELQKILCYTNMREVTILAKECAWNNVTDVYSLKVFFDRDLSICFGDLEDNNPDADQYMNKRAFFWSNPNNHNK